MKIALCLSGLLRNFKYTQPLLKKWILDPLKPDVFFVGYSNKEGMTSNIDQILSLYQPRNFILRENSLEEEIRLAEKYLASKYTRSVETFRMDSFLGGGHNLRKVWELMDDHEYTNGFRYDVVIRARCDVWFWRTPTEDELTQSRRKNTVIIPTEWDFTIFNPLAKSYDFGIMNSDTFEKYSNLINKFDEYYNQGCLMHHESMMGTHIEREKLIRIPCTPHYWYEPPTGLDLPSQNRRDY